MGNTGSVAPAWHKTHHSARALFFTSSGLSSSPAPPRPGHAPQAPGVQEGAAQDSSALLSSPCLHTGSEKVVSARLSTSHTWSHTCSRWPRALAEAAWTPSPRLLGGGGLAGWTLPHQGMGARCVGCGEAGGQGTSVLRKWGSHQWGGEKAGDVGGDPGQEEAETPWS